jgi:formylglycine-generating enzyme required for sulfatase activity
MRTCFGVLCLGLLLAVSACAAAGMTIPDAKLLPDNSPVSLSAKVVTYSSANFFYIEEDSRCMGIRVEKTAHGLTVGRRADVVGNMKTNTSRERYILATSATHNGDGVITPVGMNNMVLGGGDWKIVGTGGQSGVAETIGLNNVGLLVKTWGKYQQVNATTFTVDDGTGHFIKCTAPFGTFLSADWKQVVVTGVSSLYKLSQFPYPTVYPPVILVRDIDVSLPVEVVSVPGTPVGNTNPLLNIAATYTASGSTCSQGHAIEYSFDWGDGTRSAWSTSTSASRAWSVTGNKTVLVTARCQVHPSATAVSDALVVNVQEIHLPEMIYIPAGSFLMGNNGSEPDSNSNELPQHSVTLAAYSIGKYEVTRGEYRAFMTATGRAAPYYWAAVQDWESGSFTQTDNHPVVGVTYDDAQAFCTWAGGHLPTEAQWERAARWTGTHANVYPWGDTWNQEYCNNYYDSNPAGGGYQKYQTAPVGSYSSYGSPSGCQDMAGNVWEWCKDWYGSTYYSTSPTSDPQGPTSGSYRVLRGGSWSTSGYYVSYYSRCAYRGSGDDLYGPSDYHDSGGFRLVR